MEKRLTNSFERIKELTQENSYTIGLENSRLDGRKLTLVKQDREFSFKTDCEIASGSDVLLKFKNEKRAILLFNEGNTIYTFGNKFFINNIDHDFDEDIDVLKGNISGLSSTNDLTLLNDCYLRLIIPINKEISFRDFYLHGLKVEKAFYTKIRPVINDLEFTLYCYQKHLIIECTEKLAFKDFQRYCFSILLAYGFLTGTLHGNGGYYLSYDGKEMDVVKNLIYLTFRNSIITDYSIFTTNPYSVIDHSTIKRDQRGYIPEEEQKRLNEGMDKIPEVVFSYLCHKIHNEEAYSRAALLFLEAHRSTLEMSIPTYYVALEALANTLLTTTGAKKLKPIPDEDKSDKLEKGILSAIDAFSKTEDKGGILSSGINIIRGRIRSLIQNPTNSDKLNESFTILGYVLSKDEKKIIKERNIYLHGGMPKTLNEDEEYFKDYLHTSLMLQYLVAVFVLKSCGFNGKIIFHAKRLEDFTGVPVNGEPLMKI